MSAQVAIVPASKPRVRVTLKPVSARTTPSASNSAKVTNSAKLSRLRQGPPKPEIEVDKAELKKKLTPMQYKVTQEKFTERAFSGEYFKLNEDGKYCCIVCGAEIFSSSTKFDSGCGWPAFSDVIDDKKVIQQSDLSHVGGNLLLLALNQDLARTEVSCAKCGAHLGHVFDDGPRPTGKRYCVNSNSLHFEKEEGRDSQLLSDLKLKCASGAPVCILVKRNETLPENVPPLVAEPTVKEDQPPIRGQPCDDKPSKVPLEKRTDVDKSAGITQTTDAQDVKSSAKSAQVTTWRVDWRPSRLFSASSKNTCQGKKGVSRELTTGSSDANNNRIVSAKSESVKSRYLDHLTPASKQEAEKHTGKKVPSTTERPLLETHL